MLIIFYIKLFNKNEKNLVLFSASVFFFAIGYSCCHFTRQGTDISNKYIYIGNCVDSLISENYRSNFNDIEYGDGVREFNKQVQNYEMFL